jgi:hypothetical protein
MSQTERAELVHHEAALAGFDRVFGRSLILSVTILAAASGVFFVQLLP